MVFPLFFLLHIHIDDSSSYWSESETMLNYWSLWRNTENAAKQNYDLNGRKFRNRILFFLSFFSILLKNVISLRVSVCIFVHVFTKGNIELIWTVPNAVNEKNSRKKMFLFHRTVREKKRNVEQISFESHESNKRCM